jgi:hypothetical protein
MVPHNITQRLMFTTLPVEREEKEVFTRERLTVNSEQGVDFVRFLPDN